MKGNGKDGFRVEKQPGYTVELVALYRFYPEHPKGHPERGPFAYRWIPVHDEEEKRTVLERLVSDGFVELTEDEAS